MPAPEIVILADPPAVAEEAARRWIAIARQAVELQGVFTVALAGGSTPESLYRLLSLQQYRDQIFWERTRVFFGDERCVPPDDSRSNYRMAFETLLGSVPLPEDSVYRMRGELPGSQAALAYEDALRQAFELPEGAFPRFGLVLLGIGADGHIASLFPGMPVLDAVEELAVFTSVPSYVNPNVPRLTLTLPVLNAGSNILFLVTGESKAAAVQAALASSGPAGMVQPDGGTLTFLLDRGAASGVERLSPQEEYSDG